MQNLREKLLKAGLVSPEQVEKAVERPARPAPSDGPLITARPQSLSAARAAQEPIDKLPPLAGSKAHQRNESKRQLELDRQVRDLVQAKQVEVQPGATVFYFVTRKGKLRRMDLAETQAKQLENGELAVVERPEPDQIEHALVPAETAAEVQAIFAKAVRFFNRPGAPVGFLSDEEIQRQVETGHEDAAEPQAEPEQASQGT
jgi:uncharacterized protein YaiL (DUF2058 family)